MTDRDRGNQDAPKVDQNEARSGDRSADSGPRRVGDAREERESGGGSDSTRRSSGTDRGADRGADRGTSWISVIFG